MTFYCKNCGALLGEGNIYCLNCGTAIIVGADGDGEFETVIRPRQEPAETPRPKAVFILGLMIAALSIAGIATFFIGSKLSNGHENAGNTVTPTPRTENVYIAVKASATPNNEKSSLTKKPKSDAIEENSNTVRKMNAAANAMQVAANVAAKSARTDTVQVPATIVIDGRRYMKFDNGKPLRAICKNGEPSYWQGDRSATCLLKSGVKVFLRQ